MAVEAPSEVLVILAADATDDARDALAKRYQALHVLSSRVIVVKHSQASLPVVPGALFVGTGPVPAIVEAGLTEGERLAVAAWALRKVPKQRIGEGLPWDAAGLSPPDRPKK